MPITALDVCDECGGEDSGAGDGGKPGCGSSEGGAPGVPLGGDINSGLPAGVWLACFKRVEGEAHSTRAPAPQSDEGLEGGWVTVGSNRPRRTAFPPASFKPRSSPRSGFVGAAFTA